MQSIKVGFVHALVILQTAFIFLNLVNNGETSEKFDSMKSCLFEANILEQNVISRDNKSDSFRYKQLNYQWNGCCGEKKPIAYLLPQTEIDVQTAIRCSKKNGNVRIVPKGGGHSYGKYSFGDSETLVIDLQNMSSIRIDDVTQTVQIGPGALLGQISWMLYNNGKYGLPYGSCPTVGIGFVLGGGYGSFARLHGMAVDKLRQVELINADGNKLIANTEINSDLFWALRGGGGGSFGIITKYKFKMFKTPAQIAKGTLTFKFENFPKVFTGWQNFISANLSTRFQAVLRILPTEMNQIVVRVHELQKTPKSTISVANILTTWFPQGGAQTLEILSYLDFLVELANEKADLNVTNPNQLPTLGRLTFAKSESLPLYSKTFYVPKIIGNSEIEDLYSLLQERAAKVSIVLRALGGAINKMSPSSTAFVHRAPNLYETDIWYVGSREELSQALSWMKHFFYTTIPILGHHESYQNFADVLLPEYLIRYYGSNLHRLKQIKRKYDPENYFYNQQSVPPSLIHIG